MSVSMHRVYTMQGAKVPTEQRDEFVMHDVPPLPRHQGNEDVPGCQACGGDIGDFSSPRTSCAPNNWINALGALLIRVASIGVWSRHCYGAPTSDLLVVVSGNTMVIPSSP